MITLASTVSGTICNNLGNFNNLQGLFLEYNRLVGTIPKSLFRGSGFGANPLPLTEIFVQHNQLSGTLNDGFSTLPNLKEFYVDGNKFTGEVPESLCSEELNDQFLNDTRAALTCDGVSCPANTISREGVAPCTPCPDDGGFHRYIGQHNMLCKPAMSEEKILDLFFEQTHGEEWLDSNYKWAKGSPACQRLGIECNSEGQVTKIVLSSLGLRGPIIPELGNLRQLQVLDLAHNHLTGMIPSDLRFTPLEELSLHGNAIQGVVPPLICIKDGVNGNGYGPDGIDFNLRYACENIVCPRGTYSSAGRAVIPETLEDAGIQCKPCYDKQASFYLGRNHCTDISVAGMKIQRESIKQGFATSLPILLLLVFLAIIWSVMAGKVSRHPFRRQKNSVVVSSATPRVDNSDRNLTSDIIVARTPQREMPPLQAPLQESIRGLLGGASPHPETSLYVDGDEEEVGDDDWTAGYSEGEHEQLELT